MERLSPTDPYYLEFRQDIKPTSSDNDEIPLLVQNPNIAEETRTYFNEHTVRTDPQPWEHQGPTPPIELNPNVIEETRVFFRDGLNVSTTETIEPQITDSDISQDSRERPINWPEDVPLPDYNKARRLIREGEQMLADFAKARIGKIREF